MDIYSAVKEYEVKVKTAEEEIIHNNTKGVRAKLNHLKSKYIRYLKLEQSILKQKNSASLV